MMVDVDNDTAVSEIVLTVVMQRSATVRTLSVINNITLGDNTCGVTN